jgi:hypothetical protein
LTADLISRANDQGQDGFLRPGLRAALLEIAPDRSAGVISSKRLGHWLAKSENGVAGGFKLIVDRGDASRPRWVLAKV